MRDRANSLLHRAWLMPFMAGNPSRTQNAIDLTDYYLSAWVVFTQATKVAENLKAKIPLSHSFLEENNFRHFKGADLSDNWLFPLQTSSHAPHPPPHQRAIRIQFEIVVVFQKIPGSPTSKNSQPSHELLLLPEEFSLPGCKETVSSFPPILPRQRGGFFSFF